jgi:hypothetical protein
LINNVKSARLTRQLKSEPPQQFPAQQVLYEIAPKAEALLLGPGLPPIAEAQIARVGRSCLACEIGKMIAAPIEVAKFAKRIHFVLPWE